MRTRCLACVPTAGGNGKIVVQRGQLVIGTLTMNGAGRDKYHIDVTGPVPPAPPSAVSPIPRLVQ